MNRRRATFTVSIDLDPLPGAHHEPAEVHGWLQGTLDHFVGHYNPSVELVKVTD
jgi:hypothetical protein